MLCSSHEGAFERGVQEHHRKKSICLCPRKISQSRIKESSERFLKKSFSFEDLWLFRIERAYYGWQMTQDSQTESLCDEKPLVACCSSRFWQLLQSPMKHPLNLFSTPLTSHPLTLDASHASRRWLLLEQMNRVVGSSTARGISMGAPKRQLQTSAQTGTHLQLLFF